MTRRILQIGATGFTGSLTAAALVGAGERPVLVGRDADALAAKAIELAPDRPLETLRLDVADVGALRRTIDGDDVVVTTAGPFQAIGRPVVEAAVEAGASYLDCAGEPPFLRWVFDKLGRRAKARSARVMPGFGFDYVPGQLAGALALERADAMGVPFRIEVGYFIDRGLRGLSAGTLASLVAVSLEPTFTYRGRVVKDRLAARTADFEFGGRGYTGASSGATEHLTLPELSPGLSEVDVYQGWFGWATELVSRLSIVAPVAAYVPGVKSVVRRTSELFAAHAPTRPAEESIANGHSLVGARVTDAKGAPLAEVVLRGPSPYPLTAQFLAWSAAVEAHAGSKTVHGRVGALGPVQAFGLPVLRDAARQIGVEVELR